MMQIHPLVLALVAAPLVLCGCGGGSGGAGSCGAVPTCGGALDGTWRFTGPTCIEGDLDAALLAQAKDATPSLPSACNDMFQGFTVDATGTATFANNVETDNVTLSMKGRVVYSQACLSASSGSSATVTSTTCQSLQSRLLSSGDFATATCSLSGSSCSCDTTTSQSTPTTPQAFTVSGGHLTYADTASTPIDYCISSTGILTVRSQVGSMPVYGVNTLQR
jgi:hypothetical protein